MEQKDKKNNKKSKNKVGAPEEKLPFCTKTPSAEHARSQDEDEPCDDGRTGKIDEE
jgi:hypothetical protein